MDGRPVETIRYVNGAAIHEDHQAFDNNHPLAQHQARRRGFNRAVVLEVLDEGEQLVRVDIDVDWGLVVRRDVYLKYVSQRLHRMMPLVVHPDTDPDHVIAYAITPTGYLIP